MDNITNIRFGAVPDDPSSIKRLRLHYTQNGKKKSWDLVKVPDTISIVLFNTSKNVLLFVKQFRPSVYYDKVGDENNCEKYPPKLGVTIELCGAIVKKNIPLVDIARKTIQKELGYTVPNDRIEKVMTYRAAVGISGPLHTLFYCELNDGEKSSNLNLIVDKEIDVVECSVNDAKNILRPGGSVNGSTSFLYGVLWFLVYKAPRFIK